MEQDTTAPAQTLQDMVFQYIAPLCVPQSLASYQLSKSPSIIFPHPFSMGGTQTGCFTSGSLGEGRRLLPFCWGGFHECFWTYSACKIRRRISSGFFGEVRSMHFVRPLDLPKRTRCSTPALCHYLQDGTTFSSAKAEGFRERIYVQP